MQPLTASTPKMLLPVHGRLFVEYQLELLRGGGVDEVIICVGFLGEQVQACLGDGRKQGIAIRYSYERERLLGTGGALKLAEPMLAPSFLLTWGDSYVRVSHRALLDAHLHAPEHKVTIGVFENCGAYDASNIEIRGNKVIRYAKGCGDPRLTYIDAGISAFSKTVLADIEPHRVASLESLFSIYAVEGWLGAYPIRDRFYEIGSPSGYLEFQSFVAAATERNA
jgi:NDP-sugar pyrophosphorylase family protein